MPPIHEKRQSGGAEEYYDKREEQNAPTEVEGAERPEEKSKDCRENRVLRPSDFGVLWHRVRAAA